MILGGNTILNIAGTIDRLNNKINLSTIRDIYFTFNYGSSKCNGIAELESELYLNGIYIPSGESIPFRLQSVTPYVGINMKKIILENGTELVLKGTYKILTSNNDFVAINQLSDNFDIIFLKIGMKKKKIILEKQIVRISKIEDDFQTNMYYLNIESHEKSGIIANGLIIDI